MGTSLAYDNHVSNTHECHYVCWVRYSLDDFNEITAVVGPVARPVFLSHYTSKVLYSIPGILLISEIDFLGNEIFVEGLECTDVNTAVCCFNGDSSQQYSLTLHLHPTLSRDFDVVMIHHM